MIDRLVQLIGLIFFGVAVFLIGKEVHTIGYSRLIQIISETPIRILVYLLFLTLLNYFILSGYDWLGLQYIGKSVPYRTIFKGAGIGFALSNTAGHIYVSGSAARYLFYIPQGLSRIQILKMLIFETLTVFIGIIMSFNLSVFLIPFVSDLTLPLKPVHLYIAAALLLILFLTYAAITVISKKKLKFGHFTLKPPSFYEIIHQIIIGLSDNLSLFLVFYVALYHYVSIPFEEAFIVFILAQSIGFLSQVPGGLGVFESSFLYLFPHTPDQKPGILAGLILFRIFYYFLPFIFVSLYLGLRFIKSKFFN